MFTPSRRVGGKRVVCYDDRFIVKLAFESDGIVVSNDTYRDLQGERQEWKRFIEERLLMYSFVNDKYVPRQRREVPVGEVELGQLCCRAVASGPGSRPHVGRVRLGPDWGFLIWGMEKEHVAQGGQCFQESISTRQRRSSDQRPVDAALDSDVRPLRAPSRRVALKAPMAAAFWPGSSSTPLGQYPLEPRDVLLGRHQF